MIRRRVVLVIGAGCSVPYGFPSGEQLVENIIKGTTVDQRLYTLLTKCDHSPLNVQKFHRDLANARPASIDAFLAAREEFADMGKQAIAAELMPCEQPDGLQRPDSERDWLRYLTSRILVGKTTETGE